MRISLLILVLWFGCTPAFGQSAEAGENLPLHQRPRPGTSVEDLSGIWVGELTQNEGGIADKFEFSMQLRQNGMFMSGTSYVKLGEIWAEMELSGYQLANGSWKLTETKILRAQKPEDLSWCMKLYEVRAAYSPTGMTLHGPWWGSSEFGPCIPGSVRLKLSKKRA